MVDGKWFPPRRVCLGHDPPRRMLLCEVASLRSTSQSRLKWGYSRSLTINHLGIGNMRHRKKNVKLGRTSAHRKATLASLVCNLIEEKRIRTTLAKAKLARSLAEKMVTLSRNGTLAARRRVIAKLSNIRYAAKLADEIVPQLSDRKGGYTRIVKLGRRRSDSSEMVILEWVGIRPPERKKKKKADTVVTPQQ